jgi:hypothetical protein
MFAASFLRSKRRNAVKHRALPAIMTNIIIQKEVMITNQRRKIGKNLAECNFERLAMAGERWPSSISAWTSSILLAAIILREAVVEGQTSLHPTN